MKSGFRLTVLSSVLVACSALGAAPSPKPTGAPFDYFRNSWQVIGLKDYKNGTRITPQNELLLANNLKVQIACGSQVTPLGRSPIKTLLEGWLPVVLLSTEQEGVRYEFTLWSTPLPTAQDWKAAYAWPTEGENFRNWILVRATNLGSNSPLAHLSLKLTTAEESRQTTWKFQLAPQESTEICFQTPYEKARISEPGEPKEAHLWLDRTVKFWHNLLEGGARIEVPCAKSTQTLKAAHVCQLIASDHGELHAGEGFYDEFYIRDGGYQLLELEEAGLWEAASKGIAVYLKSQRLDGRFESQSNQFDANGQALWTLWQYWKMTRDREWLNGVYPQMRRAVGWIREARRGVPPESSFAGLLPAGVADGEFLWDGKHHIVGYDLWNLRGILCVADAARALGLGDEAQSLETEAADYRKAIDAALKRTGAPHFPPSWELVGTHWGNTETLWPTELFAATDPRVTALQEEVRNRHGGGFAEGTLRWTGLPNVIHPYLSSYTTLASLLRGEHDQFVEEYYWYLLHSSASHAFPEGVYFKRRYAWSDTIPHALGAANFAILLRHALIHERGDELHLLWGAPDSWLEPGESITIKKAPTQFGTMSLSVNGTADGVKVNLSAPRGTPPKRIVLHLPQSRKCLSAPKAVTVEYRPDQTKRWDYPSVVALHQQKAEPAAKPIPGLIPLPLVVPLATNGCVMLDLAPLANTDPLEAPFGVKRPGKFLFTGLPTGTTRVGGVPFRMIDSAQNQGRGLVVLQGADASAAFPREVRIPVGAQGRHLFLLGNVHGYSPDDEGAGEWGAVAEYVIHYTDGQTQTVPLISHRTADDWASAPEASQTWVGLEGDPWHLNVLGVELRPSPIDHIVFRDLGTPAAPVLVAVTMEP